MKITRHGPVLEPHGEIGAIFNCGATTFKGKFVLIPRVIKKGYEKRPDGGYDNYISEVWMAVSDDGKDFKMKKPLLLPENDFDIYGCEDPRITLLEGEYFITYTALSAPAFSGKGGRVGLASTRDFENVEKHGVIGPNVSDKNAVIFPELVDGKVVVLHRIQPHIQIMFFDSIDDLKNNRPVVPWSEYMKNLPKFTLMRNEMEWEFMKIGSGPPPVKTDEGWLLIYHAVDRNKVYRVGAALLDLENPMRVIARTKEPILEPEEEYEKIGDIPNVVFPVGLVVNGGKAYLYYGAADKTCCLATFRLSDLMDRLLSS
ncbi:MAG: glycosidase [Candidatus Micrarchaeota archaeon]|nr:glycosidase [Candidatus Micrarchaeota archaeon]